MTRSPCPPALASVKYDLVTKVADTMLEYASNSGAHVFTVKQPRRDFIDHPVRGANTAVKIGSHDPLTNSVSEGRAARKALGECPGLRFKCLIGNDPVNDVPSFEVPASYWSAV